MDASEITEYLYIGKTPSTKDQAQLLKMGVTLIINMRFEARPRRDSLIQSLWLPTFDSPLIWIPIRVLKRGVDSAYGIIQSGGKVYVHCHGGIHRAVAMGCCILISKGYSPDDAMTLLKTRRPQADPDIWYIRRQIYRFAQINPYWEASPE
jgi:protein-tyrosine phosphatase